MDKKPKCKLNKKTQRYVLQGNGFSIPNNALDDEVTNPHKWTEDNALQLRIEQKKAVGWMLKRENEPEKLVVTQKQMVAPKIVDGFAVEFEVNYSYELSGGYGTVRIEIDKVEVICHA